MTDIEILINEFNSFYKSKLATLVGDGIMLTQGGQDFLVSFDYFLLISKEALKGVDYNYKNKIIKEYKENNKKIIKAIAQQREKEKKNSISKICSMCGGLFIPAVSKKYCSDLCKTEGIKRMKIQRKKLSYHDKIIKNYKNEKIKEDIKKINECSIECLLKELGDIE